MLHMEPVKKKHSLPGMLLSSLITLAVLASFFFLTRGLFDRTEDEELRILEDAIRRASVQCYAIEGRYPPSVEYLEEHYGIVVDTDRYAVFYDGFASNLMPDITVIPLEKEESSL